MDLLNYGDDQNVVNSEMSNMNIMDYSRTPQYLDVNADLNSFFPKTGLTPLGQEPFTSDMSQYVSWNNGSDMYNDQGSYFPQLSIIQEPSAVESPETMNSSPTTTNSEGSEVLVKPKRGRPRKSRAKKQLSDEQEQEKRQKFLERNRQAASKCRERRKDWISKQDEKMKGEQMKNAELRAEYEILSQEVHNLLRVIHQHTEAGCQSEHLKTFLMSESSRYLASLIEPGHRAFEDSMATACRDQDSAVSSPAEHEPEHMLRQTSQTSDGKDSAITNMGSPNKPRSVVSDEGIGNEDKIMKMTNPRAGLAQIRMVTRQEYDHCQDSVFQPQLQPQNQTAMV